MRNAPASSEDLCTLDEHARRSAAARTRSNSPTLRVIAHVFANIADIDRLRLVLLLLDGPMSIGGLAKATRRDVSLVAQQLRGLRDAKLVSASPQGRRTIYAIVDERTRRMLGDCIGHALRNRRSR